MPLSSGTRFGSFEIIALIGAGGMGEVYRARDHELGRDVAIKVLPAAVTNDPDRVARFRREAQILASLNHPNIGQIYGVAEQDGSRALVLELVDGDTLADRLMVGARAPRLAVDEALSIAGQIADALDAAHAQGIVHRDLKPANVKVGAAGKVKVLDFGIAKIAGDDSGADTDADIETRPGVTRVGTIVGTASYMSPEQARGLVVDKRSDVWAFGCVLYEMLTGRRAFAGRTPADTLTAVLEHEPDWTLLPRDAPESIRRLLQRCLQKEIGRRLRDIGDVRLLIDDASTPDRAASGIIADAPAAKTSRDRAWRVGLLGLLVALAAAAVIYFRPASALEPTRLSVTTSAPLVPQLSSAVSPDGRSVAFVSADATGKSTLWVRAFDGLEGRELSGTESAIHPFWSPDSRALGFVANSMLKRISVEGGAAQSLAPTERGGGTWSRDNIILFTRGFRSGLWSMPATGGAPTQVTIPDPAKGEITHAWPQFLPDGRHFLFFDSTMDPARRGVYIGSLDSRETKQLLQTEFKAVYAPPGYLLFVNGESLMAQPFDVDRLQLTGVPSQVADGIWVANGAGQASFSASQTGVIAYVNASMWNIQLGWFDREGRLLGVVGPPDRYVGHAPEISPDNTHVAIARGKWRSEDIWILGVTDGSSTRMTFTPGADYGPMWSADGRRIMFFTRPDRGGVQLSLMSASGAGESETIFNGFHSFGADFGDWSRDGRVMAYSEVAANGLPDIWILPLEGERKPVPFLQTSSVEYQARISPNGRWIAYTSDESGREEIYVQRFPDKGSKRQISTDGGNQPRWRGDNRELFYIAPDSRLMAVSVLVSNSPELQTDAPRTLFRSRVPFGTFQQSGVGALYAVTSDGQRFVAEMPAADLGAPITVITNWPATLKK